MLVVNFCDHCPNASNDLKRCPHCGVILCEKCRGKGKCPACRGVLTAKANPEKKSKPIM